MAEEKEKCGSQSLNHPEARSEVRMKYASDLIDKLEAFRLLVYLVTRLNFTNLKKERDAVTS